MKEEEPLGHGPEHAKAYRVAYLISGYIRDSLTAGEETELDAWVNANMANQRLFEELTDEKNLESWIRWKDSIPTAQTLERLKSRLEWEGSRRKSRMYSLWNYAAAACILLAVAVLFEWLRPITKTRQEISAPTMAKDLAPGGNKAILILSDGSQMVLDGARPGRLTVQDNTQLSKQDSGLLRYQLINPAILARQEKYNTLETPPGGSFSLLLQDGTRVWLNAGSSLKYPVVFAGNKRRVSLEGEAYFEVAKDSMFPFEVNVNGSLIEVLGTHFNVNAYADEPQWKVTLEEGSVRVNRDALLRPGELALFGGNAKVRVMPADIETELAWRKGLFVFKQAPLETVMRQVARWYDCKIDYQAGINEHFNASMPRNLPVSKLLHFLEETGAVHFKIDNKRITVMR